MLTANFKDDVRELIALAKECPENLQEKCLEMLLEDFLKKSSGSYANTSKPPLAPDPAAAAEETEEPIENPTNEGKNNSPGQRDLVMTDLHLKARRFLTQYSITLDDINQLFFIEGDERRFRSIRVAPT